MDVSIVIIDIGSYLTRVGFGGNSRHSSELLTAASISTVDNSGFISDACVANADRSNFQFINLFNNGVIENLNWFKHFLRYIFEFEILTTITENKVLITLPLISNLKDLKIQMARILFNEFNIGWLSIQSSAKMCLYAYSLSSGIIINCSEKLIQITPIINNQILFEAVQSANFGGFDLDCYLEKLLESRGFEIGPYTQSFARKSLLKKIKEKYCFVNHRKLETYEKTFCSNQMTIYATDINRLNNLLGSIKFEVTEALFASELISNSLINKSIPQLFSNCIKKVDKKYKNILCENIILTGGCTLFEGFEQRLKNELQSLPNISENLRILPANNRNNLTWYGSSVFTQSANEEIWISGQQFRASTAQDLDRKFSF
eukprot:TRINITY_DN1039_c0_g2_i4.p1 TRINITY_DN1039_c0_g2~~TRINITY_DN1039_c0_g2_i4.p1  ORF type:complete len:375 (-),score=159.05 TRINITY_DN1039_c0_g2_i4:369-1493(-)